jgi:hypothetical protein
VTPAFSKTGVEQDQPLALAVLGDVANAVAVARGADPVDSCDLAVDADFAAGLADEADDCLGEFGAPRADEAVEAQDLALVSLRSTPGGLPERQPRQLQHRLTRHAVAHLPVSDQFAATDHQLHEVVTGHPFQRAALAGVAAVSQHRHVVAEGKNFLELVADEDDRDALVAQAAQKAEERLGLVPGQRGRGLVEQQHAGLVAECFGNLHELHPRHREAIHGRGGVEVEV